ncbi:hypothetical protein D3C71_1452200 [compost metagenome]
MNNVRLSAQSGQDVARQIVSGSRYCCCRTLGSVRIIVCHIFAARSLQVELADDEAEPEVVDDRKDQTDRNDEPPGCAVRNNAEQHVVDEAAGEGHADLNAENMHRHEGQSCEYGVNREQQRSHEQERELERFGNPCQE